MLHVRVASASCKFRIACQGHRMGSGFAFCMIDVLMIKVSKVARTYRYTVEVKVHIEWQNVCRIRNPFESYSR